MQGCSGAGVQRRSGAAVWRERAWPTASSITREVASGHHVSGVAVSSGVTSSSAHRTRRAAASHSGKTCRGGAEGRGAEVCPSDPIDSRACVRACARACVRAYVGACVRVGVRACERACGWACGRALSRSDLAHGGAVQRAPVAACGEQQAAAPPQLRRGVDGASHHRAAAQAAPRQLCARGHGRRERQRLRRQARKAVARLGPP